MIKFRNLLQVKFYETWTQLAHCNIVSAKGSAKNKTNADTWNLKIFSFEYFDS